MLHAPRHAPTYGVTPRTYVVLLNNHLLTYVERFVICGSLSGLFVEDAGVLASRKFI